LTPLLTACQLVAGLMTPTATMQPATLPINTSLPAATTTSIPQHYVDPVDGLIQIIETSDPVSSTYNPESMEYAEFPEAIKKLATLNSSSNNAASMLAYALGFPRQDSILAAQALISLGPDWATTDLPTFIEYLQYQRPEIRMYSAIILSTIGNKASCSLGDIGPLLWNADPYVRTSAALAIQGITGKKLVVEAYAITPDHLSSNPVVADIPEGTIVDAARTWWTESGSKVNWHPGYDLCDP